MGTQIKGLTDGVAAKDGAAIDQILADTGITQLTGDVTAGPGSGSQAATLANSGVTAGTYDSVTVDAKGRATAGSNPARVSTITTSNGITKTGTASDPILSSNAPLDAFAFALTSTNAVDATGLYAANFMMAPANADGTFEAGVVYQRGALYKGAVASIAAFIEAIAFQAGAFTCTTGVRSYRFEIIVTDGTTGVLTATGIFVDLRTDFAWAFPAPQRVGTVASLVVNPGDVVGCRLLGSQVSGAVGVGTINAFAKITLF
jgi:hypothetical protein